MSSKARYLFVVLAALMLVVGACQPQVIEKEVEVVVTQVVEVEVEVEAPAPVAGRCAPMDAAEVDMIKIGVPLPMS
ncbi:MAG: hypothetical protein HN391_04775, partial [Anaerolineae bacterium]|nr:hypothetical protein [Anaerolineae bacterium]